MLWGFKGIQFLKPGSRNPGLLVKVQSMKARTERRRFGMSIDQSQNLSGRAGRHSVSGRGKWSILIVSVIVSKHWNIIEYEILLTSMNDKSGKMKDIGTNDSTFSVNIMN